LDETQPRLPEHPDDNDRDLVGEMFFQDHDILELFDAEMDGIEDPDSEDNRARGGLEPGGAGGTRTGWA
jgi:hypothetical protein